MSSCIKDCAFLNSFNTINNSINEFTKLFLSQMSLSTSDKASQKSKITQDTIWNLRRLFREVVGEGMDIELSSAFKWFTKHGSEIERLIVVWIDLIEILVQNAEQRYGRNTGVLKAKDVKAVVRYLIRTDRIDIPHVPEYLEPIIIDIGVDWIVDAIVLISNKHRLFVPSEKTPKIGRLINGRLQVLALKLIILISAPFLWLFNRILGLFRKKNTLSPELMKAVEAVEKEWFFKRETSLMSSVADLLAWIPKHRKQLVATVELVDAAVNEVERFTNLSGTGKKAYAREIIFAVLNELGFKQKSGLMYSLLFVLVNSSIEVAVHLFKKRGALHSSGNKQS